MSVVRMSNSEPKEKDTLDEKNSCFKEKPNLKGDWSNIFILILLYTIQIVPHGFMSSLGILFQSKKMVTYEEQALFSVVYSTYVLKIVWSPLVDSIFVQKMGRRKSWLIPIQYMLGFLYFYTATKFDELVPESGKPNIKVLVILFGCLYILANVQDIAVNGWSITMLKRRNVGHSSTCKSLGTTLGEAICMISIILLTSEDFSNKYLRTVHETRGIVTIKGLLYFWSVVLMLIATLLWILKKEKDTELKDNRQKINISQSYKILWKIINKPSIRILVLFLLTMMIHILLSKKQNNTQT